MNIETVKKIATRSVGRGLLVTKKHGPAILTAVGIVGGITTTVMASKATLKLEPIVDKLNEERELSNEFKNEIGESQYRKNMVAAYTKCGYELIKLYGPTITIGSASILCIVSAHGIMQKRNTAITAAYVAMEKGFSEYRKRVAAELGEEREEELRHGVTTVKSVDENGKKVETKIVNPNSPSIYARFFDPLSKNWSDVPEQNLFFLRCQQNYANDLLHSRGHIFLNEVYDALDIPRTKAGAVVGWIVSKDGDNYVDFGIWSRQDDERVRMFVNGVEPGILLDFNVDGVIYDKI